MTPDERTLSAALNVLYELRRLERDAERLPVPAHAAYTLLRRETEAVVRALMPKEGT